MNCILFYVHDPMCSWCWAFKPALTELNAQLPESVHLQRVLGGLAPDSDVPMPLPMQEMLQQTWQRIQSVVPGTIFNFEFWTSNQPRRSTWPACRAVLAAARQGAELEVPMISAIQHAYYQEARNPSDTDTLVAIAREVGCDTRQFSDELHSDAVHIALQQQLQLARQLGISGFPGLVLQDTQGHLHEVIVDYSQPQRMLDQIDRASAA